MKTFILLLGITIFQWLYLYYTLNIHLEAYETLNLKPVKLEDLKLSFIRYCLIIAPLYLGILIYQIFVNKDTTIQLFVANMLLIPCILYAFVDFKLTFINIISLGISDLVACICVGFNHQIWSLSFAEVAIYYILLLAICMVNLVYKDKKLMGEADYCYLVAIPFIVPSLCLETLIGAGIIQLLAFGVSRNRKAELPFAPALTLATYTAYLITTL